MTSESLGFIILLACVFTQGTGNLLMSEKNSVVLLYGLYKQSFLNNPSDGFSLIVIIKLTGWF